MLWTCLNAPESAHLHQSCKVPFDEIIDAAVTCDGTWSKRGFTAMYGVVAVISWETGQVLDFEIKSKRCSCRHQISLWISGICTRVYAQEWGELWRFSSNGSCCSIGHLEATEERLHLRFTEVISDGDSKLIAVLQESEPCGKNVEIRKYECVCRTCPEEFWQTSLWHQAEDCCTE